MVVDCLYMYWLTLNLTVWYSLGVPQPPYVGMRAQT